VRTTVRRSTGFGVMTNTLAEDVRPRAVILGASVAGVAAVCWVLAARRMSGVDMGPGADLGTFSFFAATWATMMAAMMLPSALPAVLANDREARRAPPVLFIVSYLAVWMVVGIVVFFAYRGARGAQLGFLEWDRGGAYVAGAAVVAAGIYELTPVKRACLHRCRARAAHNGAFRDGIRYGIDCVGCSAGLMLVLFAVGVMSLFWMAIVAVLVFVQKVPAGGTRLVAPVAVLLLGLGFWIALAPASVPELTLPM
jgi:predicted metal-binding membrane protein